MNTTLISITPEMWWFIDLHSQRQMPFDQICHWDYDEADIYNSLNELDKIKFLEQMAIFIQRDPVFAQHGYNVQAFKEFAISQSYGAYQQ